MGYSHIQSLMRAGCWSLQRNEELWIGGDSKGKETQRSVSSRDEMFQEGRTGPVGDVGACQRRALGGSGQRG